jgi:hypothetical protein
MISIMMNVNRGYDRGAAKAYIDNWWNSRNQAWRTFDSLGGDCTNWMSQIINAGRALRTPPLEGREVVGMAAKLSPCGNAI